MFSITLLTILTLGGLEALTTANPITQKRATYLNGTTTANLVDQQIAPNLAIPAGYQVGFSTVSPCLNFHPPAPRSPLILLSIMLTFIPDHSKIMNLPANKAPAQQAAASAAHPHLCIRAHLDQIRYRPASMQRPWWDLGPTIAVSAGRATASSRPGRRTVIRMVLLAREYTRF